MPLGEVDGAELGRALPVLYVGAEDGARAFPLATDDAAHGAPAGGRRRPLLAAVVSGREGTPPPRTPSPSR